ncbi:MAG: dihydroorotate dehydrogenase electron transfer subunit [Methanomicrobiales archaeon]|nr:dihydroorotate dehydrogenase electron transfer subunit [Methanomicrobiales archaeon]
MTDSIAKGVEILGIVRETPSVRTFSLSRSFSFIPGQFVMVWVPGIDEIPMALSSANSISVQKVGDATSALFALGEGDRIGIRGPLGTGFTPVRPTLAIAGGIGAAPLLPLAEQGKVDTFLLGARTAADIPFRERLQLCTNLSLASDDGSIGTHGFVTALFDAYPPESFSSICVCGPELMMRSVLDRLEKGRIAQRGQFSVHRFMKCGIGICGSCCIDPHGLRICTEGPVVRGDLLIGSEFGRYQRDASGQRRPI